MNASEPGGCDFKCCTMSFTESINDSNADWEKKACHPQTLTQRIIHMSHVSAPWNTYILRKEPGQTHINSNSSFRSCHQAPFGSPAQLGCSVAGRQWSHSYIYIQESQEMDEKHICSSESWSSSYIFQGTSIKPFPPSYTKGPIYLQFAWVFTGSPISSSFSFFVIDLQ